MTTAASSYEAERVILIVEYSRMHKRMTANIEVVMQTARIGFAKVTGLMKFGMTPGGGAIEGIISKSMPDGSETAILGYKTLGRSSGRDEAMEHQTR